MRRNSMTCRRRRIRPPKKRASPMPVCELRRQEERLVEVLGLELEPDLVVLLPDGEDAVDLLRVLDDRRRTAAGRSAAAATGGAARRAQPGGRAAGAEPAAGAGRGGPRRGAAPALGALPAAASVVQPASTAAAAASRASTPHGRRSETKWIMRRSSARTGEQTAVRCVKRSREFAKRASIRAVAHRVRRALVHRP